MGMGLKNEKNETKLETLPKMKFIATFAANLGITFANPS